MSARVAERTRRDINNNTHSPLSNFLPSGSMSFTLKISSNSTPAMLLTSDRNALCPRRPYSRRAVKADAQCPFAAHQSQKSAISERVYVCKIDIGNKAGITRCMLSRLLLSKTLTRTLIGNSVRCMKYLSRHARSVQRTELSVSRRSGRCKFTKRCLKDIQKRSCFISDAFRMSLGQLLVFCVVWDVRRRDLIVRRFFENSQSPFFENCRLF